MWFCMCQCFILNLNWPTSGQAYGLGNLLGKSCSVFGACLTAKPQENSILPSRKISFDKGDKETDIHKWSRLMVMNWYTHLLYKDNHKQLHTPNKVTVTIHIFVAQREIETITPTAENPLARLSAFSITPLSSFTFFLRITDLFHFLVTLFSFPVYLISMCGCVRSSTWTVKVMTVHESTQQKNEILISFSCLSSIKCLFSI